MPDVVVITSRPNGIAYAIWNVGSPEATLYYNGSLTNIKLWGIKSRLTPLGRKTSYGFLQTMVDALELGALYINESALAYVSNINIASLAFASNILGYYQRHGIIIEQAIFAGGLINFQTADEWEMKMVASQVTIHELQHAYDFGTGLFDEDDPTDFPFAEQNASITSILFLQEIYSTLVAEWNAIPGGPGSGGL